jgi:ankyrin repeat protein
VCVYVCVAGQPKTSEHLHRAIHRGDTELTRSIIETSPQYVDTPDIYGLSPLMNACRLGNASIAELLLDLGADTEYCNKAGKTSLMEATYNGHLECVKLLANRGASWNKRDQSGMSALHWAVDGGHEGVVYYALNEEGVKVDDVGEDTISQLTPLLKAASVSGNAVVVRVLIDHGADVNRPSSAGQTPLILAAVGGHEGLARVLLEAGADPRAVNNHGQTSLDIARALEKTAVVKVLEEYQVQHGHGAHH